MVQNGFPQRVELYDPHPGFGGAAVPLPLPIKELIDTLVGKEMSLEEAVERLSPAAQSCNGNVEIIEHYQYLGLKIKEEDGRTHFFRLMRYR